MAEHTLTLSERAVRSRNWAIMRRAPAAFVAPTPMDPRAPAFDTAAAIAGVDTPAIGACTIGASISRKSRKLVVDICGLVTSRPRERPLYRTHFNQASFAASGVLPITVRNALSPFGSVAKPSRHAW